jgi:hypothetical protein
VPITYTISREERLIRAVARGAIRIGDLQGFIKSLLKDPDLRPGIRGIYDARDSAPEITVLQLAEIANRIHGLRNYGVGRIALVANSDATLRVSKTFTALAQALGIDVRLFSTMLDAEAWLGGLDRQTRDSPALLYRKSSR